jgi:hypothetical protein
MKSALLAALLLLAPDRAFAQGVDEFGPYGGMERGANRGSPQNVAFEVRFGPYLPNVDDEFSGATPFEDVFGDDNRYLFGLEVDWQALRIPYFGTVGPGIGWGYTTMSANAFLADGSGERADEETSLGLMPFYLVGVIRADVIARETPVPLVPYAKLGLGYSLWWSGNEAGGSTGPDGKAGKGASYGYQYALGGMLLLDFIDPDGAVQMDGATGINNSYFFAEWYVSDLDGFGSGDQMQVGTNTWMLGLAFEI